MTFLFQHQPNLSSLLNRIEGFADIILTESGIQVKVYEDLDREIVETLKEVYQIEE